MGLFYGRDKNGDGYVSPFDADETQDYVDPSKSLEREAKQTERAERRRQAAASKPSRAGKPTKPRRPAQTPSPSYQSSGAGSGGPGIQFAPIDDSSAQSSWSSDDSGYQQYAQPQSHMSEDARKAQDDHNAQQVRKAKQAAAKARYQPAQTPAQTPDRGTGSAAGHAAGSNGANASDRSSASEHRSNGLAIVAFILSLVAWRFTMGPITIIASLLAILCALIALAKIARDPKLTGKFTAALAIIIAGCVSIGWGISAAALIKAGLNPFSFSSYSAVRSPDDSPSSNNENEPEPDDEPIISQGTGTISRFDGEDKADVTIVSARRAPDKYDGTKTIVVTYRFTNRSADTARFYEFGYAVYQHGIGLSHTSVSDYDTATKADTDGLSYYDGRSESNEVPSNATADVTIAFELRDDSDIVAEVGDHYSDGYVRQGFSFGSGDELTPLAYSDAQAALKGETEANDEGMFHTWKAYKSGSSSMALALRVDGVTYMGKDYEGSDYAIVTVTWINQSKHPFGLDDFAMMDVLQNGTELKITVPDDTDQQAKRMHFDRNSSYTSVLPGVEMTVTEAFKLSNTTDKVQVQFSSRRAPSYDQSFPLTRPGEQTGGDASASVDPSTASGTASSTASSAS